MNENEYSMHGVSSFEERENRRNQQKNSIKPIRNEFLIRTVTAQFIISALIIASLFIMRSVSPNTFEQLRAKFNSLTKKDVTVEQMVSAVKSISDSEKNERKTEPAEEKENMPEASGGEDILKAQDNTTFSPVIVSREIVPPLEEYVVTSRFGYRDNPISGKYGFHTGLDMAADEGSPVRAAYDGIVTETGYTDIRGNYIIIEHSDNTETGYYHLDEVLCEIDQNVRRSQVIATVGSTGWSTGPHLHFEVKINGVNCNPEYLLNENTD